MLDSRETINRFFEQKVREHSTRDFVVYPDRGLRWSYSQFNERVDNLARGLISIGIEAGDHVGIWARNVPDWLTFMFATAKIGAVLVTVNTSYKSHELAYVLKQSDMKALALVDRFKDVDYISTIYELVPELKTSPRGHLKSEEYPFLTSVIYIGQEKHRGMYNTSELMLLGAHGDTSENKPGRPASATSASATSASATTSTTNTAGSAVGAVGARAEGKPASAATSTAAALSPTPLDPLEARQQRISCDDVVNMQYTSGTTGFPKGVMLTHRNILINGWSIGERQKFTGADRLCLPVPLFHCFGIVLGVLATLTHGGSLVMIEEFDPLRVLAAVQKEKCTALYGVPTMFIAELNHPMFDMFDLSSLRTGIMAGSPCPEDIMRRVIDDMHCADITIAYGLTEASPVFTQTSVDDEIHRRVSTVGTKLEGIEVKIVDPETGVELPPDTQGEICCRGYNIMKGYYKMPEATASAIDSEGWLHSGDLATVDKDGYYRITGRIKDMIIRGGENIYPREIEEFLYTHPGVSDVQVVGVPDPKYGETVGAFIIPKPGADLTEADIRDYSLARMARYKAPRHIFFVDSFPLTASGKIQKFKLREMAMETS